jgi:hypothetical protein
MSRIFFIAVLILMGIQTDLGIVIQPARSVLNKFHLHQDSKENKMRFGGEMQNPKPSCICRRESGIYRQNSTANDQNECVDGAFLLNLREASKSPMRPKLSDPKESWGRSAGAGMFSSFSPLKLSLKNLTQQISQGFHFSGSSSQLEASSRSKRGEGVFLVDLDKCAFFGNDANDLGVAMQWMNKSRKELISLYRLLINPSLQKTFLKFKERYDSVRVVIYTMRSDFLFFHSPCRPILIPINWRPDWYHDGQIYFPPDVEMDEHDLLRICFQDSLEGLEEAEQLGLFKSLERLLVARQVVGESLDLLAMPDMVITAGQKHVSRTVEQLGLGGVDAFLWDDNPGLEGEARVVSVTPFDGLPRDQHEYLTTFLNRHLPPARLRSDLASFMLSAGPGEGVLREGADGNLEYHIPLVAADAADWDPWPLPSTNRPDPSRGPSPRRTPAPPPSRMALEPVCSGWA